MGIQEPQVTRYKTITTFMKGRACSDAAFHVLNDVFGYDYDLEESSAMSFAGGILQHGFQCGLIWGAVLSAGARVYEKLGVSPSSEGMCIELGGKLVESFVSQNPSMNCGDITEIDKSSTTFDMIKYFLLKGGRFGGRYRLKRGSLWCFGSRHLVPGY